MIYYRYLPPANEVWDKVMFLQVSMILSTGGSASVHAGRTPCQGDPPHQGDPPAGETPLPGRPPAKEAPLPGIRSRPTSKGEIEGDQIQAHTQGGK